MSKSKFELGLLVVIISFLGASVVGAVSPQAPDRPGEGQWTVSNQTQVGISEAWYFSRFAVTMAPYAKIDLEFMELKIQPYVEIRFDRKFAK